MAVIAENTCFAPGIYGMLLHDAPTGEAGQFVMLRAAGGLDPLLPRPISIFDCEPGARSLRLLYQAVGRGTRALAEMPVGQSLEVTGPYGTGFSLLPGGATLVGGGIGIAPMLLLARRLREEEPLRRIDIHLGFRDAPYAEQLFGMYADLLNCKVGGFVTDDVDFSLGGAYYACGPEPMLRAAHRRALAAGAQLYVSLEARMACGVGACLGCSIQTPQGNRRVCKDGPVFRATEVFGDGE